MHLDSCQEKNYDVEDQDGAVDDKSVDGIGQKVGHLPQCVPGWEALSPLPWLPEMLLSIAAVSQVDKDTADDVERQEDDGEDAVKKYIEQVADLPLDDVPGCLRLQPILSQNLLTEVVAHKLLQAEIDGGLDPGIACVIRATVVKIVHQQQFGLIDLITKIQDVHWKL